jgi:hypothetical protein
MDYSTLSIILLFSYIALTIVAIVLKYQLKFFFITSSVIFLIGITALTIFAPYSEENITQDSIYEAYHIGYSNGTSYGEQHYHPDSGRLKGIEDAFRDAEKESFYDVGYSDGQYDRSMGFPPSN